MTDFFRFPSTPHLAWLDGNTKPRNDKLLSSSEGRELLNHEVVVEEKIDGANLGFSLGIDGKLHIQNRGQYIEAPYTGQFSRLESWIHINSRKISSSLSPNLILFGEWCAARHSIYYDLLPDFMIFFDVYDITAQKFWSTRERNRTLKNANLFTVPEVSRGIFSLTELAEKIESSTSRFRSHGPMEGLVVRQENSNWCQKRAKLVRPDFVQQIDLHWSKRRIEWNRLSDENFSRNSYS